MNAPVVVIGAGPAGLACTARLVSAGLSAIVIDDNARPGGQYFRQLPGAFRAAGGTVPRRVQARAKALFGILSHPLVTYLPDTCVWAQDGPLVLAYAGPLRSGRVAASAIVVATGAQDRPLPFPGWTLPGVITAGGCLNLIKGQGMLPGRRVGVVGNGPLLLVVARALVKAGAEVAVVAEAARSAAALGHAGGLMRAPRLLAEGIGHRIALRRAGVPFLDGHMIVAGAGKGAVTEVTVAPCRDDGSAEAARQRRFAVDALVTGYGLAPANELTRLFGCRHRFDAGRGGWVPERDDELQTSSPDIYAVGDCAGIGGVELALLEGARAADAIARRSGGTSPLPDAARRLRRLDRFRDALNASYLPPVPLSPADDDTLLCRCEELTLREIRAAAPACGHDLARLKAATRLSMGRCQGRNCLRPAAEMLARETGRPLADFPPPRMRPPARPVPIAQLMREALGPARPPDQVELSCQIPLGGDR